MEVVQENSHSSPPSEVQNSSNTSLAYLDKQIHQTSDDVASLIGKNPFNSPSFN
jgi:hypothetical protein